jgi:hypothetical protein
MFLAKTIKNILENIEGDTEIIAICDGNWPNPSVEDNSRVSLIYHNEPIGQRAATNEAARLSQAKFVMKVDAHCAFDKGFDVKLMADCEYDWTVVPRMYNLHAFDWVCTSCGDHTYQGPRPYKCEKCGNRVEFKMEVVWQPRWKRKSDFMRFDTDMKFQYWGAYGLREEAQGEVTDQLCAIGACWMMHRDRYWDLGGVDEGHGSWGQMGVEIAAKSWLSGGRQVVNKKTWFAHMFRTQDGFGFPYPLSGRQVQKAREHSKQLWQGDLWPKAKHPLSWMLDKFYPVPGWHDDVISKGLVYYTDNHCEERILRICREQIKRCCKKDWSIVSVSQQPIDFGENIVLDLQRSTVSMFKQILAGLEASTAEIVFLIEHDILYHPSHFDYVPIRKDVFYYNQNRWAVDAKTGQALFYYTNCPSHLVAYRELLLDYYRKRVAILEKDGFDSRIGHSPPKGVEGDYKVRSYFSKHPNVDIRHSNNLTANRFKKEQFRSKRSIRGWTLADEVPSWGKTKGRFDEFLREADKQFNKE